ncbi:MAG: hypothetical protein PHE52_02520 [Candidatus Pacebacteria bacterium]|nr:hypothetical protein [Candidatus Paceibacterota bacterium]
MTTKNTEKAMKEIFVVDGSLEINPVQVLLTEWKHPSGYFGAKIGSQPIIALRGGWNKTTTYAGFGTRQEAEEFKVLLEGYETRKVRTLRRVIDILRAQEANITQQMITRYYPPEEFSKVTKQFKSRFFSVLRTLGLLYDDFRKTMVEYERKEREKTGKEYTTASWQLFWAMGMVGDELSGN